VAQVSHRERLIEGALHCLQTKGYAKTTARDIAAAAGANLASISYHFGSKEALLNEALLRVSKQWTGQLGAQALAGQHADPRAQMATAYDATIQAFTESPAHRTLFTSVMEAIAQTGSSPELREQLAGYYDEMRSIVAQLVRTSLETDAGRCRADPDAIASFLIAVYDGFVIQTVLDPQRVPDARRLIDSLTTALAPALTTGPAARASGGT
jgi:AcrR family transcriptional regulator